MARRRKPDHSRLRREILGLMMVATGMFVLIALWPYDPAAERTPDAVNRVGVLGAWTSYYLHRWLGWGSLLLGALLLAWGTLLFFDRAGRRAAILTAAAVVAGWIGLALLGIAAVWGDGGGAWAAGAGALGTATAGGLVGVLGLGGALLLSGVALAVLVVATFQVSLADRVERGVETARGGTRRARSRFAEWRRRRLEERRGAEEAPEPAAARPEEAEEDEPAVPAGPPASAPAPSPTVAPGARGGPLAGSFLPPIDLLESPPPADDRRSEADLERLGEVLIEKLRTFNVEGEIVAIHSGPVLTQFEVKPAPGVKVNQISNLADDLALAMRAERIRIVAPIPGKGAVGIEIPNPEPRIVTLREVLESPAWRGADQKLPLALGREIAGEPIVTDLARMPHLLIAGATGSGKSVCINALVTSLLYRYPPDEVRFIMIDPKMLELVVYNGIPHLLHPVVVEHKKSAKALKWTVAEMDRRYKMLAANGIRSLADFNARARRGEDLEDPGRGEGDEGPIRPLPYIVVVIDELADLMLTVQQEVEEPLARLAQMARAVGIHLVLATQRPSVNVITGVIKANFPSRISFQVSSKIDSRTVLDMNGAEALIGDGDMLFLPADRAEPVRIQGAYLSSEETARIVDYLKEAGEELDAEEVAPPVDIIAEASELEVAALDERDELFFAAAKVVIENDQGSTSLLQRRLRVGYSRAARILDQLQNAGVVGPPDGTRPREVLAAEEDLEALRQM
ncbi:MAG: DNA translocase FtsK [Gemmatimonadota bacterium]|nr:DNA translocase FtsK [Gemmatimonadota bacterium]